MQAIEFKSSWYLAALLAAVHLVAIIVLVPLALPTWARIGLMLALAANLAYLLYRDIMPGLPSSCAGLVLGKEGLGLLTRAGTRLPCRVLNSTMVTPAVTVINVMPPGARSARSVVILPDGLDGEAFRQLRVWLKWGR
jgi:toxin CptA